jgi:hypothetical protein
MREKYGSGGKQAIRGLVAPPDRWPLFTPKSSFSARNVEAPRWVFPTDNFSSQNEVGHGSLQLWTRLFQRAYQQMDAAANSFSPRTASGTDLDRWAGFFGMERKGAAPASGRVLIGSEVTGGAAERIKGTRTVPSGTRLQFGGTVLEMTESAELPEEGTSVEAGVRSTRVSDQVVLETGAEGSLASGAALSDLTRVETLTSVSGGRRAETDEQLRVRLVRALRSPSSPEGVRAQLLSHEDVSDAQIEEGTYGPGTAEAFVTPAVAFPPASLREELETLIEGPSRIYVTLPSYEGIALKIRATQIPDGAEESVVDYINNLSTGGTIIINDVVDRVQEAGAEDATVIRAKRGSVSDDKSTLIDPTTLRQITNITAQSDRTRFYTQTQWITLCT